MGKERRVTPDSKIHGANVGPIWGRQDPGGPHVGPINFAIWDIIFVDLDPKFRPLSNLLGCIMLYSNRHHITKMPKKYVSWAPFY